MLQPVKNIDEYKRIKETLKNRFESERTGEQSLFIEQSKILQPLIKPLISTQEQTIKAIQDSGTKDLARELQRRNDQIDLLSQQPFYFDPLPAIQTSSPMKDYIKIDLDFDLNETDKENLQDMSFALPSEVFKNKQIEETLDRIKTENRSIGQKLGRGSDATEKEKEIYTSRKKTLEIYRHKIQGLEGAKQFVGKGLRTRKTPDVIFYPSVDDLCSKLAELYAAKQAGNNGVDNRINSILDELLRVRAVSKDEYDHLYKNIFSII
jgi:hypothetical protein